MILSYLLHFANRYVSILSRDEFYNLKTRLLKKYGTLVGQDLQHIKKECYSCGSTGIYKCKWTLPEVCWSCSGTGTFEEFWVTLDKYQLGKFSFHIPVRRVYSRTSPFLDLTYNSLIEGYINHKTPKYNLGRESLLWLYLIFDRKIFWREISRTFSCSNRVTPLVILGNTIFFVRNFRIKRYLPRKKQNPVYNYDSEDLPF